MTKVVCMDELEPGCELVPSSSWGRLERAVRSQLRRME